MAQKLRPVNSSSSNQRGNSESKVFYTIAPVQNRESDNVDLIEFDLSKYTILDKLKSKFKNCKELCEQLKKDLEDSSVIIRLNYIYAIMKEMSSWHQSNYRDVFTNLCFQKLHCYEGKEEIKFYYRDSYGNLVPEHYKYKGQKSDKASKKLFFCDKCGILLPEDLIEIDHVSPRSEGLNQAIVKVFRAFSLTLEGTKGLRVNYYRDNLLPLASIDYTPLISAKTSQNHSQNLYNRYTLNYEGILLYNHIKRKSCYVNFDQIFMNSIINLRPLCGPCNRSRNSLNNHGCKFPLDASANAVHKRPRSEA